MVDLRPLLAITAMLLFGTLFGLLGIALATPLVALIRLLVLRLNVDDALGGAPRPQSRPLIEISVGHPDVR